MKEAFPEVKSVIRPVITDQEIPDPQWVSGFVTGEGCFFVKITKGRNTAGAGVQILFQVSQHMRKLEILIYWKIY